MPASDIVIKGAREHNLRSVDLVLPRNQLICLTGVSGSGKSSLAFDTLYAEGQRRYVESLSSYARQFLGQMPRPEVDHIAGLSPSISISQKSAGKNPRSTVGTITEIYDYLRVLYARVGRAHCPGCGREITAQTREQIIARLLQWPSGEHFSVLAPIIRGQKGEYRDLFEDLRKQGFIRARVDGRIVSLGDDLLLDRRARHDIEVVIDRLTGGPALRPRLAEAVDLALQVGRGNLIVAPERGDSGRAGAGRRRGRRPGPDKSPPQDVVFSSRYACTHCGVGFEPLTPQAFSFNSPRGMCSRCDGLGRLFTFDPELLVPDPSLSFRQGCFELLGPWLGLGRWRRHIYQGVADTVERTRGLPSGVMLRTPWRDLDPALQRLWLWGTGELHITFTWRGGSSPIKYGGRFEGLIPELLAKHRTSKSGPQLRRLEKYMRQVPCPDCEGQRLAAPARSVTLATRRPKFADQPALSLPQLCRLSVRDALDFFQDLDLDGPAALIGAEAIKEIRDRLGFLVNVGLDYLTLDRTAPTLSGGESQRIRLAGQIGSALAGVLYILDEPSIGLHPRDNARLLDTLRRLKEMGNTVVVVEHDIDTMLAADYIVDFGPGPGVRGGRVVYAGPARRIAGAPGSLTGEYLAGKRAIAVPRRRRPLGDRRLKIVGAAHHNLKKIDVEIPLGALVCVTGVSGSGKSSLVNDILAEAIRERLYRGGGPPGAHQRIEGIEHLDKLIVIDQSPIGRTPRSNPATYVKILDDIRKLYAQLPESKQRGHGPGRFSFNVPGGRCEACQGNGANRLEMDFLADIWVTCPVCQGRRYNRETLRVRFKDQSIADVLEMDVQQALELFENIPTVRRKLQTLHDVGLDYLKLGQPSPTLSGGEAQRIKLARELVKRSTGRTLYLLDEPTTGLHLADIDLLLKVLHGFVEAGNTVLVVEHNLDVIKTADWIIDLGPEGGDAGGWITAEGTPEQIARSRRSHTGRALAPVLAGGKILCGGSRGRPAARGRPRGGGRSKRADRICVRGARQHNLKNVDVEIPRDEMAVFCGPSGSGKSSLAMDTIYAEGQRRYVESLSAYARQFVAQMQKPPLDRIEGLSPAIAIEQKNLGRSPRSTVGTITEIYDYLRILLARLGKPHCPDCERPIGTQTVDEVVDKIMKERPGTQLYLMAPAAIQPGQTYEWLWREIRAAGYSRVRVDGRTYPVDAPPDIDRRRKHSIQIVVDRVVVRPDRRSRIADSVEDALARGRGVLHAARVREGTPEPRWRTATHSLHMVCDRCGRSFDPLGPHHFSFNSPLGWCPVCEGLGTQSGANPSALLRDPKLSLADGALLLWPDLDNEASRWMLTALSEQTGVPLDEPFEQLTARQRRVVMHGAGRQWLEVRPPGAKGKRGPPLFRFQFKGLYPALEEASRLSPSFRARLERFVGEVECSACGGSRLRDDAAAVRFRGLTIDQICRMPLEQLDKTIERWRLSARERKIAGEVIGELRGRVRFLNDVGLGYLTLSRGAATLSHGESQRIRLASQLGSGLCGVLYVLDEPTIGLHPRDNRRLLDALAKLRDLGNTLLVVEHDREVLAGADRLFDFGPAAGRQGGQIVAQGTPAQLARRRRSVTAPYLTGKRAIPIPDRRRMAPTGPRLADWAPPGAQWLEVRGARHHNLQNIDVRIPLGVFTVVTGPSGSGKSSLVNDVIYAALARSLHRAHAVPGAHDAIRGLQHINKVIRVDQQPLGNSPASNPATYTGVFDQIRSLFAQLPEAKLRGYSPRRFSFNAPGGRCEDCEGNGQKRIEMHFLPDVWVECETCRGKRYNPETLAVVYRGRSISDVLEMTCGEAVKLFEHFPKIRRTLQQLCDVGLDYVTLGQPAPTLSGGEAQRVKLAAELARPDTGQTLYLFDEPTTGLHFQDLAKLIDVLQRLVDLGNTVVVIEHNLDVVKSADWVIDMGPDAGEAGGRIVAEGTPEQLVSTARPRPGGNGRPRPGASPSSCTAEALAPILEAGPYAPRRPCDAAVQSEARPGDVDIADVGREAKMPWEIDGPQWHTRLRVGRKGEPCRWDGRILERVVDRIHQLGQFPPTDWNHRTVVEITGRRKSDGWFFHAITGEAWLVKMKFRVARGTFRREALQKRLPLKTLNQLDDLPVYGNQPRVRCKNLRGPWQEVQVHAHSLDEIDTPAFWTFLEEAVQSFLRVTRRAELNPEDFTPWKQLGRKWHLLRKGFPPGKRVRWEPDLLEQLEQLLTETAPDGQFDWTLQHRVLLTVPGQTAPWATLQTKRPESLRLTLRGPKNSTTLGRIASLGRDPELDASEPDQELVKLKFQTMQDFRRGDLPAFLKEHLAHLKDAAKRGP